MPIRGAFSTVRTAASHLPARNILPLSSLNSSSWFFLPPVPERLRKWLLIHDLVITHPALRERTYIICRAHLGLPCPSPLDGNSPGPSCFSRDFTCGLGLKVNWTDRTSFTHAGCLQIKSTELQVLPRSSLRSELDSPCTILPTTIRRTISAWQGVSVRRIRGHSRRNRCLHGY
jgi:hypothetical protein